MTQHHRERDFEKGQPTPVAPLRRLSCVGYADIADSYKEFEQRPTSIFGIHQQSIWLDHWSRYNNDEIYVLCIHENDHLVFALPFEVARCRTAWVGRFAGGVHSNSNFPMLDKFATQPDKHEIEELKKLARQTANKISALYFERQLQVHSGVKNPLLNHCPKVRSPNLSLSASLEGGFEGLLSRVNGKRRMKRHRQQGRSLEAIGPVEFVIDTDPVEIEKTLDVYLTCKAKQLAEMGVKNTFAGEAHRAFMLANYLTSAEAARQGGEQTFALQSLKVAGKTRAVLGAFLDWGGVYIEIAAHANDETAQYSVGEYLICESIQDACNKGMTFYDLGLGDQRYKRSWCKEETWHYDSMIPVALYGHYLVGHHAVMSLIKSYIKKHPVLWQNVSKIRSIIGPIFQK